MSLYMYWQYYPSTRCQIRVKVDEKVAAYDQHVADLYIDCRRQKKG